MSPKGRLFDLSISSGIAKIDNETNIVEMITDYAWFSIHIFLISHIKINGLVD